MNDQNGPTAKVRNPKSIEKANVTANDIELLRRSFLPDRFKFDVALRALLEMEAKQVAKPHPAPAKKPAAKQAPPTPSPKPKTAAKKVKKEKEEESEPEGKSKKRRGGEDRGYNRRGEPVGSSRSGSGLAGLLGSKAPVNLVFNLGSDSV